jgi:hypothetical protein
MKEKTLSNLDVIYNACCRAMGYDINEKCRERKYTYPRYVYFHYSKLFTPESLKAIGEKTNGCHALVLNGLKKFDRNRDYDDFRMIHNQCVREINKTNVFNKIDLLYVDRKEEEETIYVQDEIEVVLTPNEIAYRELTPEHQKVYNERVESILKMMNYTRSI